MNPISPEVKAKLQVYQTLLHKWQDKINLVSNATLADSWARHFEDSLQLVEYLSKAQDETSTLFDLGSGAGFPGLVLAIARPDIDIYLIEADQKKCSFLRTVSRETDTQVTIHNGRIEEFSQIKNGVVPDIVTARALASLDKLFDYCTPWIKKSRDIQLIFPKGVRADEEMNALKQKWSFKHCTYISKTDENAKTLVFSDIYAN